MLNLFRSNSVSNILDTPLVRGVLIGREHAGKTVMLDACDLFCMHRRLASGLRFGIRNPIQLPKRLRRAQQAQSRLRQHGSLTTLHPEHYTYSLLENGREITRIDLRDAIGQNITRPEKSNRTPILAHINSLCKADVLIQILPCIPDPASSDDVQRLKDDFLYTEGYIRLALEKRQTTWPCTLLTVVNRIDVRYQDEKHARQRLPKDLLHWLRHNLVPLIDRDDIGAAAIVPVTAFGFQNAALLPRSTSNIAGAPTFGEREWVLKNGRGVNPFNLLTFLATALLNGLRNRELSTFSDVPPMLQVCRQLDDDLDALQGWQVVLKK